ncbi:UNVERIFIED_ORG: RNA recognition motif-containing protein [Comamonas terrigena]
MQNKLYISNLAFSIDSDALRKLLTNYGVVLSSQVILQRDTGRSRGFAFVEMSTEEEAQAAVKGLNGQPTEGRALNVAIARDRS